MWTLVWKCLNGKRYRSYPKQIFFIPKRETIEIFQLLPLQLVKLCDIKPGLNEN